MKKVVAIVVVLFIFLLTSCVDKPDINTAKQMDVTAATADIESGEIEKIEDNDRELSFSFYHFKTYEKTILKGAFGLKVNNVIYPTGENGEDKHKLLTQDPLKEYEFAGKKYDLCYVYDEYDTHYGYYLPVYSLGKNDIVPELLEDVKINASMSVTEDGDFVYLSGKNIFKIDIPSGADKDEIQQALKNNEFLKSLGIENYENCICHNSSVDTYAYTFYNLSNGIQKSDYMEVRLKSNGTVFVIKTAPEINKEYNDVLYNNDDISIENPDSALMKALKAELENIYNTDMTKYKSTDFLRINFAVYDGKPAIYAWMENIIDCSESSGEVDKYLAGDEKDVHEMYIVIDGLE